MQVPFNHIEFRLLGIQKLTRELMQEGRKVLNGNQAAGTRSRLISMKLRNELAEYRKESLLLHNNGSMKKIRESLRKGR